MSFVTGSFLVGSLGYFGHNLSIDEVNGASILLAMLAPFVFIVMYKLRAYALKAQDRAIRAEEQLRHYMLTGRPLDARLKLAQVVALRFASDE